MFSMSTAKPLPTGFRNDPWPAAGVPVEYRPARSDEVLKRTPSGQSFFWALNPYSGCEFACTTCPARSLAPFADAEYTVFERSIHLRTNAAEAVAKAMREEHFKGVPLVLGTTTDPWQPVERKALITRSILETLSHFEGVDLRAQTRSSLTPRDADLLSVIARKGKVSVTYSIGTLDTRLARLLEPLAPTPDRRFIAMEALARAGIRVGILLSPVLPGLNDSMPALEGLLRRARDSGATFASAAPLTITAAARAKVVQYVSRYDPELATRYGRLLTRTADFEPGFEGKLKHRFADVCERHGLANAWEPSRQAERRESNDEPRQLSLF